MPESHLKKAICAPWTLPVLLFLLCVLAFAIALYCRAYLVPWAFSGLVGSLILALFVGVVLLLPLQLFFGVAGVFLNCKRSGLGVCMSVPAGVCLLFLCWEAVSWQMPSQEVRRFEIVTGLTWPTEAKLVRAEHGWGFQDKRHLWIFEGKPAGFDRVLTDRQWYRQLPGEEELEFLQIPIQKMKGVFTSAGPWSPDEVYIWMADKAAQEGPFGPGYLISDRDHLRWCVWWNGI
jgi:hypothetical protein